MIRIELLILIILNLIQLYFMFKNSSPKSYALDNHEDHAQPVSKNMFKSFAKKGKIKPKVNDDLKLWQNEQ